MKKILVIAEFDEKEIKKSTRCTLAAAQQLGLPIDLLLTGSTASLQASKASQLPGIHQVLVNNHACYDHGIAENISALVQTLAADYAYILAPATSFGKDFLPRVAAKLAMSQLSDVTKIIDTNTFVRPIYAGNALATVRSTDAIKILTIRPSAFEAVPEQGDTTATVMNLSQVFQDPRVQFIKQEVNLSLRPTLENARVIISGGRAFQNTENFHQLLEPLANKLNAAIGASRAAVDAGFAPNDYQVGQTGKVVAPELYIAIGISGAVQHLAGMKESKVIVAINKDPDAAIFQIADYALVGDLFVLLPELTNKL